MASFPLPGVTEMAWWKGGGLPPPETSPRWRDGRGVATPPPGESPRWPVGGGALVHTPDCHRDGGSGMDWNKPGPLTFLRGESPGRRGDSVRERSIAEISATKYWVYLLVSGSREVITWLIGSKTEASNKLKFNSRSRLGLMLKHKARGQGKTPGRHSILWTWTSKKHLQRCY